MFDFSRNYFELFGLPVDFMVDTVALAERYHDLQKVVHPDRYANAGEQEQRLSLQQATLVNEAYDALRDPLARARYMLGLNGIDLDAQHETTHDAAFLMQQLELREALAEARGLDDPMPVLDQLLGQIGGMLKNQIAQLAVQLEAATPDQLEAARESVRKMQFLKKLHSQAEAIEAELEEAL